MTKCPACNETLPEPVAEETKTRGVNETINGVRCNGCGLMIFPADRDVDQTFVMQGVRTPGSMIARFSLKKLLGRGSFGEVWLAYDESLGRNVALKLPVAGRFGGNLIYEAKAAAKLNHPNIVSVYEAGVAGGQEFIATEYVEGQTMMDLLSSTTMTELQAVRFLIPICKALDHAHTNGIVHRDIKPGNVLVDKENEPLVTDFGLARNTSGHETLSSDGQILGTAYYMAPEQAAGLTKQTDHRADLYAVGVMLFEMLTQHMPFRGTVQAVLLQKRESEPPSPRTLKPKLSRDVETVCLKCLERDPARRYQSASQLSAELRRIAEGVPIKARPISSAERAWRWAKRRPMISGLATGLVASLTAGLVGVSYFFVQAKDNAAEAHASLYRAKMNLIAGQLHSGDITAVRQGLNAIEADTALSPLREFAWKYFDQQTAIITNVGSHGGVVGGLAISNNGSYVASVGGTKGPRDARIWDVEKQTLAWSLTPENGRVLSVDFSPSRSHVALGTQDGWVRIYPSAEQAAPLYEFKHGPRVMFVKYSADGRFVLTASEFGAVRVWDIQKQELTNEIPTSQQGQNIDLRVASQGDLFVLLKDNGKVLVRNIHTKEKLADITVDGVPTRLCLLDGAKELAVSTVSSSPETIVYSVPDGRAVRSYEHASQIGDVVALDDSKSLLTTALDGYIALLTEGSRRPVARIETNDTSFARIAVSRNGKRVAVAGNEGTVRVALLSDIAKQDIFPHDQAVQAVRYLLPNDFIATAGVNGEVRRWNIKTGQSTVLRTASNAKRVLLDFDAKRNRLAFGSMVDKVDLLDGDSGELLGQLDLDANGVGGMQFLSSGDLVVATRNGRIVRFSLTDSINVNGKRLAELAGENVVVHSLDVSPRQDLVLVGDGSGQVTSFQLSTGQEKGVATVDANAVAAIKVIEKTQQVAVGTNSGLISLHDLATLEPIWTVKAHVGDVNAIDLLNNGDALVSVGRDGGIMLIDVATGEAITSLRGHDRQVFDIAVRSDGKQLLSCSLEGDAKLWSTE